MMSESQFIAVVWFAAISTGLMAGIYFAFSTFIMQSFASIESVHSLTAMNSINKTIVRSPFIVVFFGSTIAAVILVVSTLIQPVGNSVGLVLFAGVIFFLGNFVCTAVFNIPLNNSLVNLDPQSGESIQVWKQYVKSWSNWNHVRAATSLIVFVLFVKYLTEQ